MARDPTADRFFPWRSTAKALMLTLLLLAAWPASATQEYILPTLFDVTGVAADDVLNVRAFPDASAAIIGTLPPDARGVEVVSHDGTGRWAQVNVGERSGWAALRYLAYRADVWTPGTLPPTLHCLGTEPFWSFRPQGDAVVFSTPQMPERVMRIEHVLSTGVFRDPRRSILARGGSRRLIAVIMPAACSDGMSDRVYGLDVTVILHGDGQPQMLTGCCSIAPQ